MIPQIKRKHVVYSKLVDTMPFLEWLSDVTPETSHKLKDVLKSNDLLDDFHSWYTYQTNLIKLTSKINSKKLTVLYGNFKDVIVIENISDSNLGKLTKKLLDNYFDIESIQYSEKNVIDIWIDYHILEEQS